MEFSDCLCGILGRRKKDKEENKSPEIAENNRGIVRLLQVKMEGQDKSISIELLSNSFKFPVPFTLPRTSRFKDESINHDSSEDSVIEDDLDNDHDHDHDKDQSVGQDMNLTRNLDRDSDTDTDYGLEMIRSGHLTDPEFCRTDFWPSKRLTRSCSAKSFREIHAYQEGRNGISRSPFSNTTHWSADKVLLKKYSSTNSRKFESFITKNTKIISVHSPKQETVTFPLNSPTIARVHEWLKDADINVDLQRSPPNHNPKSEVNEEILHANSIIRSLNSSSTVAHMVAAGIKIVPQISKFTSLRFVNLSSNSIDNIAAGSLPKSLHTLNLSRNNINAIVGLRELSRLRVLDLSHNRIIRIGQGLSNSRCIKELYLAENKISEVDGLHRLLKLSVLDLSFNKIATTKALGQLVANYNSLMTLNLLGNPIHTNINDDQLRKNVCSILPQLNFLNKQPISNQKVRETRTRPMSKFTAGHYHRTIPRKTTRGKVTRKVSIHVKNQEKLGIDVNREAS